MTKLLKRYYEILAKYKNGDYGNDNLTMNEILQEAKESDLFDRMSLSEIQSLKTDSFGITMQMFQYIYDKKFDENTNMAKLEDELKSFDISQYCDDKKMFDFVLAEVLKLNVLYLDANEMPQDVEAMLSPSSNKNFYGTIKIAKNNATNFLYMHEIMHYIRDVGVGNYVQQSYTRKEKGKTETKEEQEINYLTAAAVMPIAKIAEHLQYLENIDYKEEYAFMVNMSKIFGQDVSAVKRRFAEVHNLLDFGYQF